MNGTLTLKIFLSISLGLHLLFFSISSLLFPDFRINGLPKLNIEVSLLPLISETKAHPQNVNQEARNTRNEERVLIRKEKKEELLIKKEQKPESLPVQTEAKVIPASNPSALTLENEKWEMGDKKEEKVIIESYGNPFPSKGSSGQPKIAMKNPSLSDGEILFVQPKYAENPKPIYPQEARRKGYEGEVILKVEVLPNGRVGQIEVKSSSGYKLLDRSALATVKQWKFVPAQKGEKTIPLWVNIPVKFQLQ
jgi:TonB family protein